ncbi:MAG: HD domain-containing protein [Comamonadaceae bacterium]|nr:HD domain-containing protein [Comamonadaceae bacterium]
MRKLALAIFAAVSADPMLDERARQMLEAAALLHDVGYFISYDRHHKHSYHLIRHAELFDFSPREREIVANLARYHRKALPKPRHENFAHLALADQQLVGKLGGILRLADGLDRRRSRGVETLTCTAAKRLFRHRPSRQRRPLGRSLRRPDQGRPVRRRLRLRTAAPHHSAEPAYRASS